MTSTIPRDEVSHSLAPSMRATWRRLRDRNDWHFILPKKVAQEVSGETISYCSREGLCFVVHSCNYIPHHYLISFHSWKTHGEKYRCAVRVVKKKKRGRKFTSTRVLLGRLAINFLKLSFFLLSHSISAKNISNEKSQVSARLGHVENTRKYKLVSTRLSSERATECAGIRLFPHFNEIPSGFVDSAFRIR